AYAHIGSPGYMLASYIGVMYQNRALNGGGIAAIAGSQGGAQIDLFATDPNHPVGIAQNRAYSKGGGVYLIPYISTEGSGALPVNEATLKMEGVLIDDNASPEGSGIYADTDWTFAFVYEAPAGGEVYMYAGADCASAGCNSVSNNRSVTLDSQGHDVPTAGSAILMQTDGALSANRLVMRGNEGAHAIRVADGLHLPLSLDTCLLAGNTVTAELATFGSASTTINQCTFAGNSIGGPSVMYAETGFTMTNSIIAQGALSTLHYVGSGAGRAIDYVMAQETATLNLGATHLFNADPLFVDVANGDFHLRADSDAIDVAPPVAGDDRDLDNRPRDQDMPNVPNLDGDRDLGAYERQVHLCASDTIFCDGFDAN
ncbi:MAG: hypothetical protein ABIS07_09470, partial [Dokdonella sp.]